MNPFEQQCKSILQLLIEWEPRLSALPEEIISEKRNSQNRSIRQILGHLCDSASNNTHRIVHLQYRENPMTFPNYATNGNNDKWITIQNYQDENWYQLIQLWKFVNLHLVHVIRNVDSSKLENLWISGEEKFISLRENIDFYPQHLDLHLKEIEALLESEL